MANSDSYDMDSDGNDSNGSHNELIIRHFGNPLYESYEYSEDLINNNSTESDANCDHTVSDHRINGQLSTSDDTMNDTDRQACHTGATDAVMPVVRPKPRERTTIKRNNSSLKKSDIVYSNVTQNSDQGGLNCHVNSDKCGDSRTTSGQPSDERPMDELPTLISELENILIRMSSDSFYATPCASPPAASAYSCSPPPSLPPKVKPRRSQTTSTVSTTSTTSSLSLRPLPKPPKNIPPPKPPHLPPATPPPPLPDSKPPQSSSPHLLAPEVPSRFPIKDKILRDNVDMEGKIIHPMRKLSEPFHRTQPKIPIVDPYYCQHSDCRFKGIARSQTFRSSDKHNNHINQRIMSPNHNKSIIQKCGYLWKTGSNRREFLDRWCVLHRNDQQLDEAVLAYYVDRKTTSARGKIMLKDIAFVRTLPAITCKTKLPTITSTIDSSNFCYFEIGVNCRRGRIYLFAAKCLSDQKLWFSIICQAVAWDNFTLKDTFHCGYVHMKYGISGQWLVNYVLLSEGKIIVISKDFDEHNDNKSVKSSEDSDSYMSTDSCDSSNCYHAYEIRKAMSISYASVHQINSCSTVHESGQPICLTFPHKVLYFQCEYKTHTELWYQSFLKLWTIPKNSKFEDQYLTNDSIPVAIDKCINFIATYGTDTPNIYIQQNLQSPVAQAIVHEFHNNAWDLQLRMDAHSVHDITAALILFLKSMSECILTEKLYHNWIKANEHENRNERLQKFKILLNLLPIVNYLTLKKLIAHIVCIIENSDKNQTSILNLAPALCHTILFLKCGNKIVDDRVSTFDGDSAGIDIMTDFIQSYGWLFDVTTQELEKERKIQKALELLKDAKQKELGLKLNKKSVSDCEEFLIGVYVYSREWGKCLNVKLTPTMSAADLIEYVVKKTNIKDNTEKLSVYEVVYNEQLERVLHYSDIVLGVTLSWVKWSQHYSRDNYLCIKQNKLYEQIASHIAIQTPITIFSEMKFADKASKSFKKVLVEFIGAKLSVYKDEKGEKSLGQWCVEDITWYLGAEKKRSNGNKLSVTFIDRNNPIVKTKECPYFGRVLCCNTEEDYHKWIAGMLCAEYPNGVVNNGNHRQQTDLMD